MASDTSLENYGTFGAYSVLLLTVIGLVAGSTNTMVLFVINFLGTRTDHWCHVTQLENDSLSTQVRQPCYFYVLCK